MRTQMRRKEREITSHQEMLLLLERVPVGRLAVTTEDGPYIIAVNYLFCDGSIYFHSALTGRKIEAIQTDPRVCFLVDEVGPQVLFDQSCGISQVYESVICFGKAQLIEDEAEKKEILEKLINKFVPPDFAAPTLAKAGIAKTAVVKILVEAMTGKANRLNAAKHTPILGTGPTKPR